MVGVTYISTKFRLFDKLREMFANIVWNGYVVCIDEILNVYGVELGNSVIDLDGMFTR